ncbi:MAG TPA: hypothetical protein VD966_08125 [Pyrinomonadaceae bacterium]|nr:hypothetical protein [Pyrinomonadaceae bacterium]
MNESSRIQASGAVAEAASQAAQVPSKRVRLASVRVSPGGYLAATSAFTFAAFLLLRVELDAMALIALTLAWIITPALAFTDRINFDGHVLSRSGLVAFILRIMGRKLDLEVDQIERVETSAVRTLRRGGRVRYRYCSEVAGKGLIFTFASGGAGYRQMVRTLLPRVVHDKIDARTSELRDYLISPKLLHMTLNLLHVASSAVLEGAASDFTHGARRGARSRRAAPASGPTSTDVKRGQLLRRTGNELRIAGRLRESAEAFRRALLVQPESGWLIYDFARFLRSQASALGDAHLFARSRAGLRLAAQRGSDDAMLLSRVGESFFEYGDLNRAASAFRRALELDPRTFRAEIGLAEIALRNGKLAHVIHHYSAAARIAPDEALARYARREADYYARLNDDDEYLGAELRRIEWLQSLQRARRLAVTATFGSALLALLGALVDEAVSDIGWSLATSSVIAWVGVAFMSRLLIKRRQAHPTG